MIHELSLETKENVKRCIFEGYQCNCTKGWQEKNRFIAYFMDKEICQKIIDEETEKPMEFIEKIINLALARLPKNKKLLIAGGHTVINLKDRFYVSQEVKNSTNFGMKVLEGLKTEFKNIDFIIPLNDFFMEKDAGTDEGLVNNYRKEALSPYIIPPELKKIFEATKLKGIDFKLFYCSEKNMADKFKRHIKSVKKKNPELFSNYGKFNENWAYILNGKEIEVILDNKPNCVAGNCSTFRDINYIVNNSKIKDNYGSHIGIYPLCSLDNVVNGYLVGNDFYNLNLPTILIFFDKKCF
ncbi:MAG: hypothetical protein HUJ88_08220 [Fusobacterium necrophorum]|uniref:hypothetical protein n=1 Tax=Fusobacterium sp. TaxID=68766 RepID=UPI00242F3476|nr:hypothetical protein [Fusobacterium sp.]MCF0162545.1 hypothetical protein [Fusobacterium necrophorum]MCI7222962.1 hypothetical protein [Fusobacterium sp.]MDY2573081.1 hypothetical protein [Fusobacterium necrophorum]